MYRSSVTKRTFCIALILASITNVVIGQSLVDSLLNDSFFNHLLQNEKLDVANSIFFKKLEPQTSNAQFSLLKYSYLTQQNQLCKSLKAKDLKTCNLSKTEQNQTIKYLIIQGRKNQAYFISNYWKNTTFKPELLLLTEKYDVFEDSVLQKSVVTDSLYQVFKNTQPRKITARIGSIIPGLGKMILGNVIDGSTALIMVSVLAAQAYENADNSQLLLYAYLTAATFFYFGSVYGTQQLIKKKAIRAKQNLDEGLINHIANL